MLSSLFHKRKLKPAWFFLLVLVSLGTCTVAGYHYAKQVEHARIANAFNDLAVLETLRLRLRVDSYARTLVDLRGLFVADTNVTNDEFQRFLDGVEVLQRYPPLLRIGYAPLVTNANRADLESRLRSMGSSRHQASPDELPILYGYPALDALLGMDLDDDHGRGAAMGMARDINQPQLSPYSPLRFEPGQPSGFVIYLPLYGAGKAAATVAQRRQALSGYLFAAFRPEDLIETTIGTDLRKNVGLALFDGALQVYHSGFKPHSPAGFTSTQRAKVGGRPWTFVFVALPAFVQAQESNLPMVILVGGLLTSILAARLAYVASRRWLAEGTIRYLAFHDELTGMPNRASLRISILAAIEREQATKQPCALIIVELLRFRDINYTLGHPIGDEVLKQASARIRNVAGRDATPARVSNVQFGVLMSNAGEDAAINLAERLVAALEEPLPARDCTFELGARAGIAFAPVHGDGPDDLIRHADIALHRASTAGAKYVVYDPELDPYKPQRLALLSAFRQAVKQDQLQMYCQPKANLHTGQIISVEALVRWQHPDYGLLTPDQFISLIEPTELIQLLTQRMLECAMRQAREWRQEDLVLPLAVNLSARNLLNPALPELVGCLMKTWGADASWIGLEITESSIMNDPVLALRVLNRLHAMGLELIVDDFGTGYSSLSYLMKLPVAVIKIDQSFIINMTSDPDAAAIVKAMIELAHNLGMKVVAEGTETREIWDALKRLDCDEAQGYYISQPLPAHAFRAWLDHSPWQCAAAQEARPCKKNSPGVGETGRTRIELPMPNNGKR